MDPPPRAFLTREQMALLPPAEMQRAVAEMSSYVARLKQEAVQKKAQEEQAHQHQGHAAFDPSGMWRGRGAYRGGYRGSRARGGGRGRGGYHPYAPPTSRHLSVTFNQPTTAGAPSSTDSPKSPFAPGNQQANRDGQQVTAEKTPCPAFTSTGICKRQGCPHSHDPDKTAICRYFLNKGYCRAGQACPLSHQPSAYRSPHCIHFQNGHCTKEDCPYAHVQVNIGAPVCESFGRLGYCDKGEKCADRHAFECPDFANKGSCEAKGCRLAHVTNAARMRNLRRSSELSSPQDSPKMIILLTDSSDDSDEADETDGENQTADISKSDREHDDPAGMSSSKRMVDRAHSTENTHAMTQQHDFIPLGDDSDSD